jgi:hypothetical protein
MKFNQIAAALIATSTLLNGLPAQADAIYNLNPVARVRTNAIYQDLSKYPDIHCHIAVQVYHSVKAVDKKQGLAKSTINAVNAFVSAKCKDDTEAGVEFAEILKNPVYQRSDVQLLVANQFLDLNGALNELGEGW